VRVRFTRNDLRLRTDAARFERGRALALTIGDLYEDEWSLVATIDDQGKSYQAMVHDGSPPLSAECDCREGAPPSFCEHSVAVGLYYLGDDEDFA